MSYISSEYILFMEIKAFRIYLFFPMGNKFIYIGSLKLLTSEGDEVVKGSFDHNLDCVTCFIGRCRNALRSTSV